MSAPRMIKIDRGRIHPNMTEDEIQSLALDMMAQMTSAEIRIWEPHLADVIRRKAQQRSEETP